MSDRQDESQAELDADHTPEAIRTRLRDGPSQSYLRDFVYGAIDGTVTTFAIVSGALGAELSSGIVIVLGVANLIGDGFSMAVSNYLGTRAENQQRESARRAEEYQVRTVPEGEREEIRQIFADKGFEGADLERVVEVITAEEQRWVDTMLKEELGLTLEGSSPIRAGLSTFVAFMLAGLVPLLAFLVNLLSPGLLGNAAIWSAVMTGITFFAIGALKARFVQERWLWAGTETLVVGGAAAGLAFLVGMLLKGLVDAV